MNEQQMLLAQVRAYLILAIGLNSLYYYKKAVLTFKQMEKYDEPRSIIKRAA